MKVPKIKYAVGSVAQAAVDELIHCCLKRVRML